MCLTFDLLTEAGQSALGFKKNSKHLLNYTSSSCSSAFVIINYPFSSVFGLHHLLNETSGSVAAKCSFVFPVSYQLCLSAAV